VVKFTLQSSLTRKNKKFEKKLTAQFPFTTYSVSDTTLMAQKAQEFNSSLTVAYIRYHGNVFTEPLPGNVGGDTDIEAAR
jgi:hypothetical protein